VKNKEFEKCSGSVCYDRLSPFVGSHMAVPLIGVHTVKGHSLIGGQTCVSARSDTQKAARTAGVTW
jgi:hypothetical protein